MRLRALSFAPMTDHSSAIAALAQRLHSLEPRRDVALAPYTTFRIGGPADLFCEPASADDLALAVCAARAVGVPYFVLGLGANILIGDKGGRIKSIGARARQDLAGLLERPVHLFLNVKERKGWDEEGARLRAIGLDDPGKA